MSIVEKLDAAYREMVCARPVGAGDGNTYTVEPPTRERFRKAVLTATGLTEAQLEGLAKGTHYIIERPRFDEGHRHASDDFRFGEPSNDEVRRAMLAAKDG